jgi:hypothetical protein
MARKYLVPIDLSKQELQNAVIQNLASAPASPVAGQVYFNTTDDVIYFYDGAAWVSTKDAAIPFGTGQSSSLAIGGSATDGVSTNVARADHTHAGPGFGSVSAQTSFGASSSDGTATTVARADHTHGTPAHTNTEHSSINLSALAAPTADVSMGSFKLTNLADPVNNGDAANKGYVDNAIAGLAWKDSVHLLAEGNVALTGTTATLVIDGHAALDTGDVGYRILLIGQTTASQNGIYVYADNGTAYTLSRATDADTFGELIGAAVFVKEGTEYEATAWVQANHYLTDFTNQEWVQFSGQGTYLASNGVQLVGNTFSFAPKNDGGLQADSSGASLKLQTNSGLATSVNGLAVGAGTGISVSTGTVAVDTAVVARKYAVNVGNNVLQSITVTHNLNNLDVTVQVYEVSTGDEVYTDISRTGVNTVAVGFAVAPTSNQYRVVVIG